MEKGNTAQFVWKISKMYWDYGGLQKVFIKAVDTIFDLFKEIPNGKLIVTVEFHPEKEKEDEQ